MWLKKTSQYFLFCLCVFIATSTLAQSDTTSYSVPLQTFNKKRLTAVITTEAIVYTSALIGLNEVWYKDFPHSPFHFFNDDKEWLQMDKAGHAFTAYTIGRVGIDMMKWTGVSRKKAIWFGGMMGSVLLNTVEVLDGYSSAWGFSGSDIAANTAGSLFVIGQELLWDEQRIVLKYSFQQSKYAKYRPSLLGGNFQENLLKDYNGQTYWLSVNLSSFMKKETKFPKWLNIALGYGANGMIGARANPLLVDITGKEIYFERYRQYYLSLDIDLARIKTKSKFVNTVFKTIGFIKFPFPALEFNKYGTKGLWVGF